MTELYRAVEEAREILERANAGAPEQPYELRVACQLLDSWLCAEYERGARQEGLPV